MHFKTNQKGSEGRVRNIVRDAIDLWERPELAVRQVNLNRLARPFDCRPKEREDFTK